MCQDEQDFFALPLAPANPAQVIGEGTYLMRVPRPWVTARPLSTGCEATMKTSPPPASTFSANEHWPDFSLLGRAMTALAKSHKGLGGPAHHHGSARPPEIDLFAQQGFGVESLASKTTTSPASHLARVDPRLITKSDLVGAPGVVPAADDIIRSRS